MGWSKSVIFTVLVLPALVFAPADAYADRDSRSTVDPTLQLSTDIGGGTSEPAASPSGSSPAVTSPLVPEAMAQTRPGETGADPTDNYRIDTGDGISVTVYGEPDLSVKDERVNGNGRISYPLLGDILVRGRTATELQQLITELLADGYLKKPNVTVSIETFRLFYIKGEVRNPGGFNYVDGLTVEKAVALAGGYTERASERNITVVRDGDPQQRARQAAPGMRIRPGDVITVGESFF